MIDLDEDEQRQLMVLAEQIDAVNGRLGSYGAMLDAIERMTTDAMRIPAELLCEPVVRSAPFTMAPDWQKRIFLRP